MNPQVIRPFQSPGAEVSLLTATIIGVSEVHFSIQTDTGIQLATRALGCLVEPIVNDTVLCSTSSEGVHILSVLSRRAKSTTTISVPGDAAFEASNGSVNISSASDVVISPAGSTDIISKTTRISGGKVQVAATHIETRFKTAESSGESVRLVTNTFDMVAKRITQHAGTIMRNVTGSETLNIGNRIQMVKNLFTSHAEQTSLTSQKDTRIDGERIHMG